MEKMKRLCFIALIITLLVSCSENKTSNKTKNRIGRYVYIDQYGVTHTSLNCSYINYTGRVSSTTEDADGYLVYDDRNAKHGSGVERVLLKDYDKELLANACKSCVDDDMYEYLQKYGASEGVSNVEEQESGDMVFATLSGRKYHKTAECSSLKRSKGNLSKISVEQAEADGKEPCSRCYNKIDWK